MTIIISVWGCFATEKNVHLRNAENAEKGKQINTSYESRNYRRKDKRLIFFFETWGDYSHVFRGTGNFHDSSLFRRFGNVAISPKWLGI